MEVDEAANICPGESKRASGENFSVEALVHTIRHPLTTVHLVRISPEFRPRRLAASRATVTRLSPASAAAP
jgi:hypothetical protein